MKCVGHFKGDHEFVQIWQHAIYYFVILNVKNKLEKHLQYLFPNSHCATLLRGREHRSCFITYN